MNIEKAKLIPISLILEKMARPAVQTKGHKSLHLSPLRDEKTASLWADNKRNTWRDFGDFKWEGGDTVRLAQAYLDSTGADSQVADALRWLKFMTGTVVPIKPVKAVDDSKVDTTITMRKALPISKPFLIKYGESRGIPQNILRKYFEQAELYNQNSGKTFYTLCMQNDMRGYELRNDQFKGCIGRKYTTYIRGSLGTKTPGVHIFEGAFDYATVITQRNGKPLEDDAFILHSISNLKKCAAYIKGYGYKHCYTWMDNDSAGKAATESWDDFCKKERGLIHVPQNEMYVPHKDVNAAHMAKLKL